MGSRSFLLQRCKILTEQDRAIRHYLRDFDCLERAEQLRHFRVVLCTLLYRVGSLQSTGGSPSEPDSNPANSPAISILSP